MYFALRLRHSLDDSPEKSFVKTRRVKRWIGFTGITNIWSLSLWLADCHFPQCVVALSGMGGCSQWLKLDQDANRVLVWVTASFGRLHRWIIKACCCYSLKIHVNSMVINKTCFWLDLQYCCVLMWSIFGSKFGCDSRLHLCDKQSLSIVHLWFYLSMLDRQLEQFIV